ncbi:unnamed protein product [Ectocarpus sp. 13 AM-2016]
MPWLEEPRGRGCCLLSSPISCPALKRASREKTLTSKERQATAYSVCTAGNYEGRSQHPGGVLLVGPSYRAGIPYTFLQLPSVKDGYYLPNTAVPQGGIISSVPTGTRERLPPPSVARSRRYEFGEGVPLQARVARGHGGGEVMSRCAFCEGRVLRVSRTHDRR